MAVLPAHVEQSLESILEIYRKAENDLSRPQRAVERTTAEIGKPRTIYAVLGFVLVWTLVNALFGKHAIDPPPFYGLQGLVSLAALLMTCLILTTENRQGKSAARRAELDLQLTALTEAKVAKLIELIEALRRDDPHVANRSDPEAQAMTSATDPRQVLEAVDQHHRSEREA